jgi:hypothetical protein
MITMVQELLAASAVLQVLADIVKSVALVPEIALLLVMFKVTLPELVRVIVCAALAVNTGWPARLGMDEGGPKVREAAERLASGAPPVPVRFSACEPPGALSLKAKVAGRLPAVAGVNVTPTVQVPFTAIGLALVQVLLGSA